MEINGHTRLCGLIGNPVEHTLSPVIHNTVAEEMHDNLVYVPFHVEQRNLQKAIAGAYSLNVLGLNVTVPYKQAVIPYLDCVEGLAEKYEVPLSMMVGFLDGINDSLKEPNPIDTMEKDTEIKLDIDCEKLYYNMVDCNAEWLYTLPQWDSILSAERRKELYRKQKNSGTIRREEPKIGRNDPCPCGSGKKYKKCCGR